jgi:endonuclease/exonuclease/phosphatase family metal-dependent hydrolase
MKKILKIVVLIIALPVVIFAIYLIFMTLTDFKPQEVIPLEVKNPGIKKLSVDKPFTVTTFNIGYGGLDKDQDFFMDGGTGSRGESAERVRENMDEIIRFLRNNSSSVVLLQEVDVKATRSYSLNQVEEILSGLSEYSSVFAYNYRVPWVPVPVVKPMGAVQSGLLILSEYKLEDAHRYQLPGSEKWPVQLAELDRCFIETRIAVDEDRELVLLNVHLSAYDKGGLIRKQQLSFLKNYLEAEHEKGNYIIVGGDYNHQVPGTDSALFPTAEQWPDWLQTIPEDFLPAGFKWVADKHVASNRTIAQAYVKGENFLSVIDGFLVSPGVEVLGVMGHDLGFENSDHNPVTARFVLK